METKYHKHITIKYGFMAKTNSSMTDAALNVLMSSLAGKHHDDEEFYCTTREESGGDSKINTDRRTYLVFSFSGV